MNPPSMLEEVRRGLRQHDASPAQREAFEAAAPDWCAGVEAAYAAEGDPIRVAIAVAGAHGSKYMRLEKFQLPPHLFWLWPAALTQRLRCLPIKLSQEHSAFVATPIPLDAEGSRSVAAALRVDAVEFAVAPPAAIARARARGAQFSTGDLSPEARAESCQIALREVFKLGPDATGMTWQSWLILLLQLLPPESPSPVGMLASRVPDSAVPLLGWIAYRCGRRAPRALLERLEALEGQEFADYPWAVAETRLLRALLTPGAG